jgi:hypothetical protein
LTTAGRIGVYAYVSASSAASKLTVAGLQGWSLKLPPPPATTTPTPTITTPAPTPTTVTPTPTPTTAPPTTSTPSITAVPTTEPATSAPATTEPATTEPATTDPATTEPSMTEPPTEPATTEPVTTPPPAPALQPGASNTGVPAGTTLTPYYGDLNITEAGATYNGLDIHGFVTVRAPNVTITNSIIRGGVESATNVGIVTNVSTNGTNFVLTDSELVPEFPSVYIDGIKGWNYTLNRVNIHGTVDTAKVFGDNATIENSWLHDTVYYDHDPYQGGGHTHNDGVQVLSGTNIHIQHNTITGAYNAAMQVTQGHGAVNGLWFTGNWADGGGCTVNLNNSPMPTMGPVTVSDNRFGHDTRNANCPIIATQATQLTATGNVWDDTGAPVAVRNGG